MKKSQLRNIIKESIKGLINEQSLTCYTCINGTIYSTNFFTSTTAPYPQGNSNVCDQTPVNQALTYISYTGNAASINGTQSTSLGNPAYELVFFDALTGNPWFDLLGCTSPVPSTSGTDCCDWCQTQTGGLPPAGCKDWMCTDPQWLSDHCPDIEPSDPTIDFGTTDDPIEDPDPTTGDRMTPPEPTDIPSPEKISGLADCRCQPGNYLPGESCGPGSNEICRESGGNCACREQDMATEPAIPIWPSKTADDEIKRMQELANIKKK